MPFGPLGSLNFGPSVRGCTLPQNSIEKFVSIKNHLVNDVLKTQLPIGHSCTGFDPKASTRRSFSSFGILQSYGFLSYPCSSGPKTRTQAGQLSHSWGRVM